MNKLKILLPSIAVIGICLFYYFSVISKSTQEFKIVLGSDGFKPESLTINKGDMVVFTTIADKPFWPASDLHPSHTIYPEFDPKKPIEASGSWSFRFDKKGNWKFHDHLFPLYRGIIIVK